MGARAATPAGERPSFLGTTCPSIRFGPTRIIAIFGCFSYSVACPALSILSRLVISFSHLTFSFLLSFLGPIVLGKPGTTHRKLISWWSDLRDPPWSTPGPGWIPRAHHAASLTPVQFKTVVIFQRRRGRHWPRESSVRVRCVRMSMLAPVEP